PNLFGLNRHASGELIISLTAGFIFLFLIAVAYRSGDAFAKRISKVLIGMVFALGFLGILVDSLHFVIKIELLQPILTIIEDGGEMVVMSLVLSFILLLPERMRDINKHRPSLINRVKDG
ncbi:MAG: hypothetical protein F6J97_15485, partial [Leptolyngbya sp. SIO4C1]|nr:hypothetical protein [Leptolyngbya sp. SIO4C1]